MPRVGNFYFITPAKPFVIREEIFFLYSWLRHSYRKNPIPISLQTGYRSFPPCCHEGGNAFFLPHGLKFYDIAISHVFMIKDITFSSPLVCYWPISECLFHARQSLLAIVHNSNFIFCGQMMESQKIGLP